MELNEGIRLLTGQGKIDIPLKKKVEPKKEEKPKEVIKESFISGPVKSRCVVEENGKIRTFIVTSEPILQSAGAKIQSTSQPAEVIDKSNGHLVFHPFAGSVEVVDILVKVGDKVEEGQIVANVEAMKAKHNIKSGVKGTVSSVNVKIGDEIDSSTPILIIN
jgi:biotin carboxyl carrier protein